MYQARLRNSAYGLLFALVCGITFSQAAETRNQRERKPPEKPATAENAGLEAKPEDNANEDALFKGMNDRGHSPFRGGPAPAASGIGGDPTTYYCGATGGGVWKPTYPALTWTPVFD